MYIYLRGSCAHLLVEQVIKMGARHTNLQETRLHLARIAYHLFSISFAGILSLDIFGGQWVSTDITAHFPQTPLYKSLVTSGSSIKEKTPRRGDMRSKWPNIASLPTAFCQENRRWATTSPVPNKESWSILGSWMARICLWASAWMVTRTTPPIVAAIQARSFMSKVPWCETCSISPRRLGNFFNAKAPRKSTAAGKHSMFINIFCIVCIYLYTWAVCDIFIDRNMHLPIYI